MKYLIVVPILVCIISKLNKLIFGKNFIWKLEPQKDIKTYLNYLFNQAIS